MVGALLLASGLAGCEEKRPPSPRPASSWSVEHWQARPARPTFFFKIPDKPLGEDKRDKRLERAQLLMEDRYEVRKGFEPIRLSRPLQWTENPLNDNNWEFNFHSLRWSLDLVNAYLLTGEQQYLAREIELVDSWIRKNPRGSSPSAFAWDDHGTAWRAIALSYFWEVCRKSVLLNRGFLLRFLPAIREHGEYLSAKSNYKSTSNHGCNQNAALLTLAVVFRELEESATWRQIALERTRAWVERNFTPAGAHLEQSAFYHWYVLTTLAEISRFIEDSDLPEQEYLDQTLQKGADFLQYLLFPDSSLPMIGDSQRGALPSYSEKLARILGRPVSPPPRQPFRLYPRGGYGFYRAPTTGRAEDDLWFFARVRSFKGTHSQDDGTHFILWAHGHPWFNDSGYYNYMEKNPYRIFFRSSRAHNVVIVDGKDFDYAPVTVTSAEFKLHDLRLALNQDLPGFDHRREFRMSGSKQLEILDDFQPKESDGSDHVFDFLLHLDLAVEVSDLEGAQVVVRDEDGNRCSLKSVGDDPSAWDIVSGQDDPIQGWISYRYGKLEKNQVLRLRKIGPGASFRVVLEFQSRGARDGNSAK